MIIQVLGYNFDRSILTALLNSYLALLTHAKMNKYVILDVVRDEAFPWGRKQCGEIDLSKHSLLAVRKMIEYCYTGDYDVKDKAIVGEDHIVIEPLDPAPVVALHLHGQMFSIAQEIGIRSLEHMAASNFHSLSATIAKRSMWSGVALKDLIALVPKIEEAAFEGSKKSYQNLVEAIAERIVENLNLLNDDGLKQMFRKYPWVASDIRECRNGRPTSYYLGHPSRGFQSLHRETSNQTPESPEVARRI
ncbi:MAG: hypothetical protein Q9169_008006 [Polycauliona sp. 2 TL-2023]